MGVGVGVGVGGKSRGVGGLGDVIQGDGYVCVCDGLLLT